jgi:hypothetical protein
MRTQRFLFCTLILCAAPRYDVRSLDSLREGGGGGGGRRGEGVREEDAYEALDGLWIDP